MAGEFFIRRENTGGESITTTESTLGFDTSVSELYPDFFSFSEPTLTLKAAGHYLVGYDVGTVKDTGANTLYEWNAKLVVGGADSAYGRSSGYAENAQGALEAYSNAATILSVSANATVEVHVQRTDTDGMTSKRDTTPQAGGLWALKLDDNADYLRLRLASDGAAATSTFAGLAWDTEDEVDTVDFAHSTVTNPERFKLKTVGKYLLFVQVYLASTSGVKTLVGIRLMNITTATALTPGRIAVPIANATGANDMVGTIAILIDSANANDEFQVEYAIDLGLGNATPKAAKCSLTCVRITTDQFALVRDDAGGQREDLAATTLLYDTVVAETATTSFDAAAASDDVTVKSSMTALVCYIARAARTSDPLSTQRIVPQLSVKKNGTASSYGRCSQFDKGDSVDQARENGLSGAMLLAGLVSGDVLAIQTTNKATANDANMVYTAALVGWQCVNVSRWFQPDYLRRYEHVPAPNTLLRM